MSTKTPKGRRLTLDPERTREQRERFERAEREKREIRRRMSPPTEYRLPRPKKEGG